MSSRLSEQSHRFLTTSGATLVASLVVGIALWQTGSQAAPASPQARGFPSPPAGGLVFARQDGENVLALAVKLSANRRNVALQSSVVGQDGLGVAGLPIGFEIRTGAGRVARVRGVACGVGCYAATGETGPPGRVTVAVGRRRFEFILPRPWPHSDATELVRRSGQVWRNLRTLVWRERLGSGHNHLDTVYRAVAPNRFGYRIAGGAEAVVIGTRRWDRSSAQGSWEVSRQLPALRQPVPFWSDVRDAHVVGSPTVRGHRAWRITFFDPATPAWFSVDLDQRTLRTLSLQMLAAAHFMRHVYRGFNQPLKLEPPTR